MKNLLLTTFIIAISLTVNAQVTERVYYDCALKAGPNVKEVFDACPRFKGGQAANKKYFTIYTKSKKKEKKQVFISVIVEKDGSALHPRVEQGISPEIDKLAIARVNSSPKWRPAILKGKPVRFLSLITVNVY